MSPDRTHGRRWWILVLVAVAVAQLMVVLDATIVNIALPSAQDALHFSDSERQWIVTAYTLAFGSLLLVGGRIGDFFGRRPTLVVGLIGFAAASALGGASATAAAHRARSQPWRVLCRRRDRDRRLARRRP